ncbi:hypothetical protein M406DRAFT_331747 [Cryphonectria parasitica EP155]|uniref:Uncharacterized protein n=1 Tax=Cryphonectria parasitica (strain ATCC 38755 / EP155) TaxID=660469 RepID=A0A9P5CML4_CRYP1|nr:uncharacterized protein M406DRAFT_331747 [Cryphonectria parasitica EP155]KAF3763206.1 hypothetical protein M406DRAFT_331747 [Cryphonectria parasitica EP155]
MATGEKTDVESQAPSVRDLENADAPGAGRGLNKTGTNGLHEFREDEGYIIDDSEGGGAGIKLAEDGHTRLIPQPSDDPRDPLNWSWKKKHAILFVIAAAAFLPDYGSATGAVTLELQAAQWGMTADEVNHSQAGNVFMLGAGGVFDVDIRKD